MVLEIALQRIPRQDFDDIHVLACFTSRCRSRDVPHALPGRSRFDARVGVILDRTDMARSRSRITPVWMPAIVPGGLACARSSDLDRRPSCLRGVRAHARHRACTGRCQPQGRQVPPKLRHRDSATRRGWQPWSSRRQQSSPLPSLCRHPGGTHNSP